MTQKTDFQTPSDNLYEIIAISEKIQNSPDIASLKKLYDKYCDYNHPQICYDFGRALSIMGDKVTAKEALYNGSRYGLHYPCGIYDSPLVDSIGQCMSDLVTQYPIGNSTIVTKITSLSYIYLSRCIELFKRQAQDSYRTRALLFKDHNSHMIPQGIIWQNLGLGVLIEPFILSDFYFASQATDSPFKIDGLRSAQDIHNRLEDISINGKDADEYSIAELALVGENRHLQLFKSLEEKYRKGELNLSQDELNFLNR